MVGPRPSNPPTLDALFLDLCSSSPTNILCMNLPWTNPSFWWIIHISINLLYYYRTGQDEGSDLSFPLGGFIIDQSRRSFWLSILFPFFFLPFFLLGLKLLHSKYPWIRSIYRTGLYEDYVMITNSDSHMDVIHEPCEDDWMQYR